MWRWEMQSIKVEYKTELQLIIIILVNILSYQYYYEIRFGNVCDWQFVCHSEFLLGKEHKNGVSEEVELRTEEYPSFSSRSFSILSCGIMCALWHMSLRFLCNFAATTARVEDMSLLRIIRARYSTSCIFYMMSFTSFLPRNIQYEWLIRYPLMAFALCTLHFALCTLHFALLKILKFKVWKRKCEINLLSTVIPSWFFKDYSYE